jgi:UDP-N-acetylmuramate dehydrogenase
MQIQEHTALKDKTTFRLGGEALYFCEAHTEEDVVEAVLFSHKKAVPVFPLGTGSNTIFSDTVYQGVVMHMCLRGVAVVREDTTHAYVKVSAGEDWDTFVAQAITCGWHGLENLSYIPGTVGASPVQNIGAYGMEVGRVIDSVRVYDTQEKKYVEMDREVCRFGYRTSIFKERSGRYIIVSVLFRLEKIYTPLLTYKDVADALTGKEVTPQMMRECIIAIRTEKLPNWHVLGTAGSFFKNPEVSKEEGEKLKIMFTGMPLYLSPVGYKIPAGYLIEHVIGMKGVRHKGVGVYEHHALVLVNYGEGTYQELCELVSIIKDTIYEKTHIIIEPEVQIV